MLDSPVCRNKTLVLTARVAKEMQQIESTHLAAGVAYYALLSLFPLLLGLLALGGILLSSEGTYQGLLSFVTENLPGSKAFVEQNVGEVVEFRGVVGVGAILGFLWTASIGFGAVARSVNRAWGIRVNRPFYVAKPLHILMALAVGALFLISTSATSVIEVITDPERDFGIPAQEFFLQLGLGHLALRMVPWGINVFRVIRRKNEDVLWQSWQREGGGFLRVSRAGHLTGLADLPQQGLSLETKTFLLAGRRQEANELGAITSSYQREVGIDIKTEVRPGLVLDLTVNTDFAQVEVDDAQVNLTRFSLFFPEKRDFFLENSGIFDFGLAGEGGMRTPAYQMLFSRNIGISRDGAVPILAGARLTGRVGGQTVGLLNVVTDEAYGAPRENFAVARIKRDVGQSAYIGAMMVDRRSSDGWNTTAGIDGQFVIGSAWIWDWYAAQSFTEGQGGDGYSYSLKHSYDGPDWRASFTHYAVSPNADAAGGFITRTDIRQTDAYAGPKFRPSALGLRDVGMFFMGGYGTTVSDGRMQDWRAGIGMNPTWKSGEQFTAILNTSETVVDEGFRLSESVEVPAGRYRADRLNWFAFSSPRRAAVLGSSVTISNFYGGTLMSLGGTLSVAPSPQISFTGGYTRNQVDVPDGGFNADISSLRASYSYSTKLSTNVLVQYNSLQKAFSTNVRFNFIHRPGSDFFIVFTENHGWDGQGWELSDRGMVMKLTYLARM